MKRQASVCLFFKTNVDKTLISIFLNLGTDTLLFLILHYNYKKSVAKRNNTTANRFQFP